MNTTIKLSVSSVLLAGFMTTGCSQQQFQGGGQQITGGSQVAGGSQIAGGQQITGGSQLVGGQQVSGGSQVAGGQQVSGGSQVAGGQQILGGQQTVGMDSQIQQRVVVDTHSHNIQTQSTQAEKRVYVPLPAGHKAPPAVVMFKQPKPIIQTPAVTHRPTQAVQRPAPVVRHVAPKPIHRPKPVVQHRGIGMPPAQPGQCFAKVKQPAKFKNVVKRVQVSPATSKRVLVRAPQYRWNAKKVLARPATHTFKYIPAQYRTITKRVLVKPAHYTWQKGKQGPITRIDNMTGEILCRVKVPAVYRTVTQKVVARPAQRLKRNIPAVYKTVKQKQFVAPAQYKTVRTPARFVNKSYRVKVSDVRYQWKPIACKAPSPAHKPRTVAYKPQQSAEQRRLKQEFDRQQQILKREWMQQEAQRQQAAAAKKRQTAAQQRQAALKRQQIQLQKQRQAQAAQKRRHAQHQANLQAQAAQKRRQAQHQANLQAQRRAAQVHTLPQGHQQPAYAKPKAKVTQVRHIPKPRPTVAPARVIQAPSKTQTVMHKAPASNADDKTPLTRANAVYRIQKALQQRGFKPGPVDGRLGPTTVKALTAFQETQGLKTGTLNRDTLRALNLVQ